MTRKTFTMHNAQQGHTLLADRVWPHCKPLLIAGHRLAVTVAPAPRTNDQSAKYHAMIGDVARGWHAHCGQQWTPRT